jgi:hypothetical protein
VTEPLGGTVEIEVVEVERVVPRGTSTTRWYVRQGDGWLKVGSYAGAVTTSQDAGAGTIWERVIKLRVAVGTAFRRADDAPAAPERMDPFAYLKKEAYAAKHATTTRYYRATRNRRLVEIVKGP